MSVFNLHNNTLNQSSNIINGSSIISTLGPSMTFGNETTHTITFNGPAFFKEIKLNNIDLEERLGKIEQRLGIINRNIMLENKYSQLRKLAEEYKNLETELLEKEKVWEILKK